MKICLGLDLFDAECHKHEDCHSVQKRYMRPVPSKEILEHPASVISLSACTIRGTPFSFHNVDAART